MLSYPSSIHLVGFVFIYCDKKPDKRSVSLLYLHLRLGPLKSQIPEQHSVLSLLWVIHASPFPLQPGGAVVVVPWVVVVPEVVVVVVEVVVVEGLYFKMVCVLSYTRM